MKTTGFVLGLLLVATAAVAAPTRSSSIALDGDRVFVVNPDSDTIGRLDYSGMTGVLTHEEPVGDYPRTVAVAGGFVFSADQTGDTVSRRSATDLGGLQQVQLGAGCAPYGIAPTPDGSTLVVSCQGSSEVVLLSLELQVQGRVKLGYRNARAIAISSDGGTAYVTHYLTEEPGTDGHVSVVDLANKSVSRVIAVAADRATCESQNSGQGVLNLLSAIALIPDGAPSDVAGQLWVGGTQQNNIGKGLFKREPTIKPLDGAAMFPLAPYAPFPTDGFGRNVYRASFHDITRFGIVKVMAGDGTRVGKVDVDEANNATDIEFSPDGTTAYVVDVMFHSYHIFNTKRGQGDDVTTLFAAPSQYGPGGANPDEPCIQDALRAVTGEGPYRIAPQAQLMPIGGYNPSDTALSRVDTGVEFDAAEYWNNGTDRMKRVPDGIGTAPIGVRVSPDGQKVFVHNYLARNVVVAAGALPATGGLPDNFRCTSNAAQTCGTDNDCSAARRCATGGGVCANDADCGANGPCQTVGFCNHPGGAACATDGDCGSNGPCILSVDCVPLVLKHPVSTIRGRCDGGPNDDALCLSDADCSGSSCVGIHGDPLPPSLLDGKILFNTAARDASVDNQVGLRQAAPLFNNANDTGKIPGSVTSTAHDASYVTCTSCHADFGGQDGRTWDFSQFGASLRNTMDLRGRSGFNPGTCSHDDGIQCFFDAACGAGNVCTSNPAMVPLNVPDADRDRWFNPMLTVHWNGDRDEVEDFEATFRQLQGAGDCDAAEDTAGCQGALVQRATLTTTDPPRRTSINCPACCTPGATSCTPEGAGSPQTCGPECFDVEPDLGPPNRNLPGHATGKNVGYRLTHMADFVYSLTELPKNPNQPTAETELGRALFADPVVNCASCHSGGPGSKQFFTDKRPNPDFDRTKPGRPDTNNPFIRHNVGTANVFDEIDPLEIAQRNQIYQNSRIPIPGSRGSLGEYVTPILNDVWNTPPFLHDGSAHSLLDVVRHCDSATDDCTAFGRGRNVDRQHGNTGVLTPSQLNAITAFQEVLTVDTRIGNGVPVLEVGTMTIKAALVQFPKTTGRAKPASSRLAVRGEIGARTADPSQGVTLELAFPDQVAGRMRIAERTFAMAGKGKGFSGKATQDGTMTLKLKRKGDGFGYVLVGKKLALGALDTGNRDFTVAFRIGDTTFVKNRYLEEKKRRGKSTGIFTLPKRKR